MNDKLKHFIAGFLLSSLGAIYVPLFVLGFFAGLWKEMYDRWDGGFSFTDMFATWAGAALAIVLWLP